MMFTSPYYNQKWKFNSGVFNQKRRTQSRKDKRRLNKSEQYVLTKCIEKWVKTGEQNTDLTSIGLRSFFVCGFGKEKKISNPKSKKGIDNLQKSFKKEKKQDE